jgi:hypothetical protein
VVRHWRGHGDRLGAVDYPLVVRAMRLAQPARAVDHDVHRASSSGAALLAGRASALSKPPRIPVPELLPRLPIVRTRGQYRHGEISIGAVAEWHGAIDLAHGNDVVAQGAGVFECHGEMQGDADREPPVQGRRNAAAALVILP